jgi:hypothetical protein
MVKNITGNGKMIVKMDMEKWLCLMDKYMKESGRMIAETVKDH